jgi:hypothetical protein
MLRSSLVVLAVSLLATGCTVRTGGRAYSPASSPVAAPAQATYPASAPAPAPAAAPAEEPGWDALGGRQVAFHAERDAIAVNPGPTYRSIRLHVSGNDLEMYDVRVTFGNGEVWSPNTRLHFGQGTSSRQIDLPGGARHIQRIEFGYRARGRAQGHAFVQVVGHS